MHAKKCLLSAECKLRNSDACNNRCSHFVAMHGLSGTGGRVAAANVPADYRLVTVANSPARASQPQVYRAVDEYVTTLGRQFEDEYEAQVERLVAKGIPKEKARVQAQTKSLYLWSTNTGTGKSTTASAILNSYLVTHYLGSLKRNRQALQCPAYFLSVNNMQQTHNKTHMPASLSTKEKLGEELIREIERAKKTPFLVMDDLAVRKATNSFAGILYDICDYRTSNKLPTVFTSNKSLDELREYFFDEDPEGKIVDRIRDMAGVIGFTGESRRGMRR